MSSPPHPSPSSLPSNPKKRPSISSLTSLQPPTKKIRDQHPLRQYSLPGPIDTSQSHTYTAASAYHEASSAPVRARSPSQSAVGSTLSQTIGQTGNQRSKKNKPGKLGRPRKTGSAVDVSTTGTQLTVPNQPGRNGHQTSKSQVSGTQIDAEDSDADPDDDLEESESDADLNDIDAATREETRLNTLLQHLTPEQSRRYYAYKAAKLSGSVVRRIINQTVGQSVGKNQVEAVQFFAKHFVVDLIERARDVQTEWSSPDIIELNRQDEIRRREEKLKKKETELARREAEGQKEGGVALTEQQRRTLSRDVALLKADRDAYVPSREMGLGPDHIREALRRYLADGEGGGVGFGGETHPLLGVHGANSWVCSEMGGGRRLFR